MFDSSILKSEEKISFALRSLYSRFGYERYKMGKFEEYDLYVRNKDFLISDSIITFTDTNGRLMALKPDVTLSIIKNVTDVKGTVNKFYYDENVYRISGGTNSFKEIAQTGLECIGDIGVYEIAEVVCLAVKSLALINDNYILDLSHAGFVSAVFETIGIENDEKKEILTYIKSKNFSQLLSLKENGKLSEGAYDLISKLMCTYKSAADFKTAFAPYSYDKNISASLSEFSTVCDKLTALGMMKNVNIDFSIIDDVNYYSGVIFKGYIKGIPATVLSGGQYDKLMKKIGKASGALGFAVYVDMFERMNESDCEYDCDCLIIKNKATDPAVVLKAANQFVSDGKKVKIADENGDGITYRQLLDLREGQGE
ncbi:MAG: ATP phosphoribosyltransferase regulatory subunit [Clostridia bacterium]|nr:ATP phosphoribosyltransferase regulatory subunit [Clostridia bacterium]